MSSSPHLTISQPFYFTASPRLKVPASASIRVFLVTFGVGGEGKDRWEIPPKLRQRMTEVARQFRKNPTPSEAILWQALRNRKLEGRKFRRQQPIGNFVVDFFCSSERLIVEIDGEIHESQKELDQIRQELLESLGLRFVRISSELVETNLPLALDIIRQAYYPHPPAPSPNLGEGE